MRRNAARLTGEFRRRVCWALEKWAATGIPDDILDMIADWALNDPDPGEELWQVRATNGQLYYEGDPYLFGINTNRGAAVRTLVKCLVQRQPPQIERAFALPEQAATDPSTAVRVCVIDALTHLRKYDRERTFAIFSSRTFLFHHRFALVLSIWSGTSNRSRATMTILPLK